MVLVNTNIRYCHPKNKTKIIDKIFVLQSITLYICTMSNTKDNKEATIIFRTSQETKKKLEALASKDSRTLSNYLNLIIEKILTKKP